MPKSLYDIYIRRLSFKRAMLIREFKQSNQPSHKITLAEEIARKHCCVETLGKMQNGERITEEARMLVCSLNYLQANEWAKYTPLVEEIRCPEEFDAHHEGTYN